MSLSKIMSSLRHSTSSLRHSMSSLRPRMSSLRSRLTLSIILSLLPVIFLLVFCVDRLATSRLRAVAEDGIVFETRDLASVASSWDQRCVRLVQTLAATPGMTDMDPDRQREMFGAIAPYYEHVSAIKTTRPDGSTVACSDDHSPGSYGDRAWLRQLIRGRGLVRQALIARSTQTPVMIYAAPLRDRSGRMVGTISVAGELSALVPSVARGTLGETGHRFLVDAAGRVLAHPDSAHGAAGDSLADSPVVAHALGTGGRLRFVDEEGVGWLCHTQRLPNGWHAIGMQQEAEVLAGVRQFRNWEALILLVGGIATAGLTWINADRVARPLERLGEAAVAVAEGRFDLRADEQGCDELKRLAISFNHMVSQLHTNFQCIEARVERRTQALCLRNAELQQARNAAEQQTKLKDEFLATMGHEIRTPLTAIVGYAELLVDLKLTEEERNKALQSIQENGQHLLGVINDVLDLAKLDARKMESDISEFPPVPLVNDVLTLMRSKAADKKLRLDVEFHNELPELIRTDLTRLRQILLNLVGNAVKFTQQGQVRLGVRLIESTDGREALLRFEVSDTGIGMVPEQIERLFEPFSQGIASTVAHYGGSGLGLAISQRLARLLGGEITVRSAFGEGSTFSLTIGIGPVRGQRMMNPELLLHDSVAALPFLEDVHADDLAGVRILLADDRQTSREMIGKMFKAAGATVDTTGNGRRAVHAAWEAFEQRAAFDVIVLDVRMPEMDGITAVRRLRQLGYPGVIIILTASVDDSAREECLAAGANDFGRKPMGREKLIRLIAQWAEHARKSVRPRVA